MLKGDALCDSYRDALRQLYGDDLAEAAKVYYASGWYYVKQAHRCHDGSLFVHGIANAYRRKQIIERRDRLLLRVSRRAKDAAP